MSAGQDNESQTSFTATRNYTTQDEKNYWYDFNRRIQNRKYGFFIYGPEGPIDISKQAFRTRRDIYGYVGLKPSTQALRAQIGNNNDIGSLLRITNLYVLIDEDASENFCTVVKDDLPDIPVIKSSICGCRVVGCMTVGNKHGLIVPETIYDTELEKIKEELPDSVEVRKLEERLSAVGNVIACNDKVALIHPELDKESEEIIADTLQVEVFRHMISDNPLVGSYCVLNNNGGLIPLDIEDSALENLASLLQLPLIGGTVNSGNKTLASGLVVNDLIAYAGMKTTSTEFTLIEKAFQFKRG